MMHRSRISGIASRLCWLVALVVVTPALSGTAEAHGYKRKGIEVVHPWTSERAEADGSSIIGMKIKNASQQPDRVVAAESSLAERVEICAADGAPLKPGIPIPVGAAVDLKHGTLHLRMIGLKKSLTPYDTLPVVLELEKAGRISIDVIVEEALR